MKIMRVMMRVTMKTCQKKMKSKIVKSCLNLERKRGSASLACLYTSPTRVTGWIHIKMQFWVILIDIFMFFSSKVSNWATVRKALTEVTATKSTQKL